MLGFTSTAGSLNDLPPGLIAVDAIARNLNNHINTGHLTEQLRSIAPIDFSNFKPVEMERAKCALSFLAQAAVWTDKDSIPSSATIPANIAQPLVAVSKILDEPPIFTYGDNILRNWFPRKSAHPYALTDLDINYSFSGTPDERNFTLVHVLYEFEGATAISAAVKACKAADQLQFDLLKRELDACRASLHCMREIFLKVRDAVSPSVFRNEIRWYLQGWKNIVDVQYEGCDIDTKLRGETGAQSSVLPFLDRVFCIDQGFQGRGEHSRTYREWEDYMPRPDRKKIRNVSPVKLRDCCIEGGAELAGLYNACIKEVAGMRQAHFAVVGRYISAPKGDNCDPPKGTGGTDYRDYLAHTNLTTQKARIRTRQ